jgi:hypothetical protein
MLSESAFSFVEKNSRLAIRSPTTVPEWRNEINNKSYIFFEPYDVA